MISTFSLGSLGGFMWVDDIILVVPIAFVVGLIMLVRFFVRTSTPDRSGATPKARLQKLDSMRSSGAITEAEYQEQRRRIVSQV